MNIFKNILKTTILVVVIVSFGSCEDDFDSIGNNIIGENDFITEPYDVAEITSYSKKITAVQSNGLPFYFLGAYNDPIYGLSEVSILSQLSLGLTNPDFGTNPVMDSVVLVLPYYSHIEEQTEDETTYALDSVYGTSPVKVSVYESNYFLSELDPETDFEDPQLYYSNQAADFEANLGELLLDEEISPDDSEVIILEEGNTEDENGETVMDTLQLSPRIRLQLPKDFFQQKILDKQGSQELLSNANFKTYFRGLYLKAEAINGEGSLSAINFAGEEAKVILYYTSTTDNSDETHNKFELNFQGNVVNVYNNNFPIDLSTQDTVDGEENLYLKGGEGSMAVIKLFSGPDSDADGVSDELEMLREKDWLINEANLTFVVNSSLVPESGKEPKRLFIYDLNNNKILLDYQFDYTANDSDPSLSRVIHLVPLSTDEEGNRYYKIRLTGHLRNVINLDSTNVKLGLAISSNVNLSSLLKLKDSEDKPVSALPATSILSPKGTILYGNNAPDENKRLKLNIFYTKPE